MGTRKSMDYDHLEVLAYLNVAVACPYSPTPVRSSGHDE